MSSTTRRGLIQTGAALTGGLVGASAAAPQAAEAAVAPPLSKRARFRALLTRPGVTVVPEAYSLLAGRVAELNGFEAIYVGGNLMSAMYLGLEDWGLITTSELVEIGGRIAGGVNVPAIIDADQLGENALNAYRGIKAYEQAGIAALHMEDTRNPKHLGAGVSEIMPLEEMVLRIQAAKEGRTDPQFTIIARSDCLAVGERRDINEAIRRGNAFAEAGADAFFLPAMKSDDAATVARAVSIPLIGLNNPLPAVQDSGIKMLIHAVAVYQPMVHLYDTMMRELKEHGQFVRREERRLPPQTMAKLLDTGQYRGLVERWNKVRGS